MDGAALKNFRQRVVGRRQTVKHIKRGSASLVYIARDADSAIRREIESQCRAYKVPLLPIDTMRELGQLCGIDVGAACAAIVPAKTAAKPKGGLRDADH